VQQSFVLTAVPTTFSVDPATVTECLGSSVLLTVLPQNAYQTTYQWKLDGSSIGGATQSTYSISSVGPTNAGAYTCECTNACGTFTSAPGVVNSPSALIVSYCACDAGNGPCFATSSSVPGNPAPNSAAGRGCVHSIPGNTGALLSATGSPSIQADSLVLTVVDVPNSPVILYQAPSSGSSGVLFFDGLACVAGPLTLLCATTSGSAGGFSSNSAVFPGSACGGGLALLGGLTMPTTVHYQVRFKDYGAWCTSSTSNSSNALSVTWCP
jgi:hypothetical protein